MSRSIKSRLDEKERKKKINVSSTSTYTVRVLSLKARSSLSTLYFWIQTLAGDRKILSIPAEKETDPSASREIAWNSTNNDGQTVGK